MQTKSLLREGLALVIVVLFVGIGIIPITGSLSIERHSPTIYIVIHREYFLGSISNITVDGNNIYILSYNMRRLVIKGDISGDIPGLWTLYWNLYYTHYNTDHTYFINSLYFRGILRPHFICGVYKP
jgi:hypothetical protein